MVAVARHLNYHSLDSDGKAIVNLGLNSILDLSFQYPAAQTKLFQRDQRKQLNVLFLPKKYPVEAYDYIKELLSSLNNCYNKHKSKDTNWANIYKELKRLDNIYGHKLNTSHNDTSFCIYFLLCILFIEIQNVKVYHFCY